MLSVFLKSETHTQILAKYRISVLFVIVTKFTSVQSFFVEILALNLIHIVFF